jgi:hypothetical protein
MDMMAGCSGCCCGCCFVRRRGGRSSLVIGYAAAVDGRVWLYGLSNGYLIIVGGWCNDMTPRNH